MTTVDIKQIFNYVATDLNVSKQDKDMLEAAIAKAEIAAVRKDLKDHDLTAEQIAGRALNEENIMTVKGPRLFSEEDMVKIKAMLVNLQQRVEELTIHNMALKEKTEDAERIAENYRQYAAEAAKDKEVLEETIQSLETSVQILTTQLIEATEGRQ